jgi:hypothetical protein
LQTMLTRRTGNQPESEPNDTYPRKHQSGK